MNQHREATLLVGACQWIRDNLRSGRNRIQLAEIYLRSQDDLTPLRRAIEGFTGQELTEDEDEADYEMAELLAELSEDVMCTIDLTLAEAAGYGMAPK